MAKSSFEIIKNTEPYKIESLFINRSKKRVKANFNAFSFVDNDTNCTVFYIPSLDISGYGDSVEEAKSMAFDTMHDLVKKIVTMSYDNSLKALKELGWEKSALFNKQFSKAFVDAEGQLQGFNVKEDSLTALQLVTP